MRVCYNTGVGGEFGSIKNTFFNAPPQWGLDLDSRSSGCAHFFWYTKWTPFVLPKRTVPRSATKTENTTKQEASENTARRARSPLSPSRQRGVFSCVVAPACSMSSVIFSGAYLIDSMSLLCSLCVLWGFSLLSALLCALCCQCGSSYFL